MKIFYGIQGTGNGHITRGRVMAKELQAAGFDVTYHFSGRPKEKFFEMAVFNHYLWNEGLTFKSRNGKVNYIKSAYQAKPIRFLRDIKQLDLSRYDIVISDFEPVSAWASRRQNKKVIGIGHQYAFFHDIPRAGSDPLAELVMKNFAPADVGIGLHWHHFNQPILPPIIETPAIPQAVQINKIVVYLPFENQHDIITLLAPFKDFEFFVYSPEVVPSPYAHIHCHPLSRQGFQQDLYNCAGIISNAGFELASESLQLGKKILAKPLHAQMEQVSNALALKELGYGHTMHNMDPVAIEHWLHETKAVRITYPNIARYLVKWIADGLPAIDPAWLDKIWAEVKVLPVDLP
ncbi:MAG: glycosyl transferase [Nitrosomonas sp.]|nr:MAG: glycosyl transferase [Nitrosomonas sp.]